MKTPNARPVVRSLLENDLYKFTMWQALLHSHPGARAGYSFVCRNTPVYPLAELKDAVEVEIDHLCTLSFAEDELTYLRRLDFLKSDFVDFLSVFRFQRRFIEVRADGEFLRIEVQGPLVHVMAFEIFVLYIVNELYFRRLPGGPEIMQVARQRLQEKIGILKDERQNLISEHEPFIFFDFGLRRRYTGAWHEEVVKTLKDEVGAHFRGTSNVYFAKKFDLLPIGTMAHEYLQAYQAFGSRLRDFQKAALEGWVQEFRGDLGIALSDTYTSGIFLSNLSRKQAKLFDGVRCDSGNEFDFTDKLVARYKELGIDSTTKTIVFSNALDFTKALDIQDYCKGKIRCSFGIGTNLTNDVGVKPMNIVMKLIAAKSIKGDWIPTVKLSDEHGKYTGDPKMIELAKEFLRIKE